MEAKKTFSNKDYEYASIKGISTFTNKQFPYEFLKKKPSLFIFADYQAINGEGHLFIHHLRFIKASPLAFGSYAFIVQQHTYGYQKASFLILGAMFWHHRKIDIALKKSVFCP